MPYIVVENFGGGMDVRRSSAAAPGGTMREIRNAFVNKGGEIEKRRKWQPVQDSEEFLYGESIFPVGEMCGPIPTFERDGVWFCLKDYSPAAVGDFVLDGNGATAALGDYRFALLEAGTGVDRTSYTSVAMFTNEMIVALHQPTNLDTVTTSNFLFPVASGQMCPSTGSAISGRTGVIDADLLTGSQTMSMIAGFDSCIYAATNIFSIVQSEIGSPEDDAGTGYAAIDIRPRGAANGRPIAVARYFSQLAVFCENGIQFWDIDPDPANWAFDRSIDGEALVGPRAVIPFGANDLLYITDEGIRSLRARDSSNFAVTTDLGSPIDELVAAEIAGLVNYLQRSPFGLVHRATGQAWVFVGSQVFVHSRYPSSRVSAWTVFDGPETESEEEEPDAIADACPIRSTVCLRLRCNEVFLYGDLDLDGEHYDAAEATVTTHYFGVEQPFTEKVWRSIDLACEGTWEVEYSIDPRNESWVSLGSVTGDTHLSGGPQIDVSSPLMAFRFRTTSASAAKLSQFAIHYDVTEIKA